MCIFNGTVENVSSTNILVAKMSNGRQLTIYENSASVEEGKNSWTPAMILPFPRIRNAESLYFVDMSNNPQFFKRLEKAFQFTPYSSMVSAYEGVRFKVKRVGSYELTVVPSLDEFSRVDASVFSLDPSLGRMLRKFYGGISFSFLVCKLVHGGKQHPFAFVHDMFPGQGRLFVPTRHFHGSVPNPLLLEETMIPMGPLWDHTIFTVGGDDTWGRVHEPNESDEFAWDLMKELPLPKKLSPGLVRMREIRGLYVNQDLLVELVH